MSKGLFITAIGTDIGKTYVTGLLVKRLRDAGINASYYKAALSGAEEQPDGTWLPGDAFFFFGSGFRKGRGVRMDSILKTLAVLAAGNLGES